MALKAAALAVTGSLGVALVVSPALGASADPTTDTLVFTPTADTYVSSATPSTSYGTASEVWVDASPTRRAFLRFNVAGLAGRTVLDVRLRVHQLDASSSGGRVWPQSSTTWSETTTWASRPKMAGGTPLATFGRVAAGGDYEVSLGSHAVTSDGQVSFALDSASSDGAEWATRESVDPPQLFVVLSHSGSVTGDGTSRVSTPYAGSSDPTQYPSEKHLAVTAGGRVLAVHGMHSTGVRLTWRDGNGGWTFASQGASTDGRLLSGVGTGDRPASIVTATGTDGAERAYAVWGGTVAGSAIAAMPVDGRVVSGLDAARGPAIGTSFPVAPGDQGNYRPDVAVEHESDGTSRLFVAYLHRTGSSTYQLVGRWSGPLGPAAPVMGPPIVLMDGSSAYLSPTVVTTSSGLALATRDLNGRLAVLRHAVGGDDATWTMTEGMRISYAARASAVPLLDGTVVVTADVDTTNHVVAVQRFGPDTAASPDLSVTGYAQPSLATDGTNVWLFDVRVADTALTSRAWTPTGGWTANDAVALAGSGVSVEWPNALRVASGGHLLVITRGFRQTSDRSEILAVQRPATPGT